MNHPGPDLLSLPRALIAAHQALIETLTAEFDLDTGAELALTVSRHATLTRQLANEFDLDAGLDAILASPLPTTTPVKEPLRGDNDRVRAEASSRTGSQTPTVSRVLETISTLDSGLASFRGGLTQQSSYLLQWKVHAAAFESGYRQRIMDIDELATVLAGLRKGIERRTLDRAAALKLTGRIRIALPDRAVPSFPRRFRADAQQLEHAVRQLFARSDQDVYVRSNL